MDATRGATWRAANLATMSCSSASSSVKAVAGPGTTFLRGAELGPSVDDRYRREVAAAATVDDEELATSTNPTESMESPGRGAL